MEKEDGIITGKFRIYFFKWLENQFIAPYNVMFESIPVIVQNAYLIKFLDTMGIFVELNFHLSDKTKELSANANLYYKGDYIPCKNCDNREEATNAAVLKGIETFNNINADGTV